ncbi:hypothetical protein V6N11_051018 [Hibiscus sabdariffa]|uniref:Uncharacterized protein n=1 Tax=Hibiscus sabdariffa TaxID=183260 RepID=A0ABR2R2L5_9ROSI
MRKGSDNRIMTKHNDLYIGTMWGLSSTQSKDDDWVIPSLARALATTFASHGESSPLSFPVSHFVEPSLSLVRSFEAGGSGF